MTTHQKLEWNRGSLQVSGRPVSILSEGAIAAEPGNFKDLRHYPQVVAVAVPSGMMYKAYNMRDDGKMVKNGTRKTWESLADIQNHFEELSAKTA